MVMLLKRKMCRYNTPSRSIDILIKCWYWGRCGMWVSSGSDVCHLLPAPAPVRNHCILCCAAWCVINGRGEEFELWVGGGPQDYSDSPSPILTLNNWDFLVFDSNGLDLGLGNWTWAFQFHIFGIAQDLSQRGQPLRVGLFSKNQMKECHQKTKPYQTSWEQHRIPFLDCSAV